MDGHQLDDIVVTATKTEKEVGDASAAVTVITGAAMERRNIEIVDLKVLQPFSRGENLL